MSKERVGRNDPCPCGSGKKFKQCCGQASPLKPLKGHVSHQTEGAETILRVIGDPESYKDPVPAPSPLSRRKFSAKIISAPQMQQASKGQGHLEYSCFERYSEEARAMMPAWKTSHKDYRVSAKEVSCLEKEKFILPPPRVAPISLQEKPSLPPEILPQSTIDFREN